MKKITEYKIKNYPSILLLFLNNEIEVLGIITFDKDFYKTKKRVFENIMYYTEMWEFKISKRKANEIAKKIKWYL